MVSGFHLSPSVSWAKQPDNKAPVYGVKSRRTFVTEVRVHRPLRTPPLAHTSETLEFCIDDTVPARERSLTAGARGSPRLADVQKPLARRGEPMCARR
ncbi:hypothetical protein AAFF_G00074170 [Aldrovandia affinis]|uniref:Uncharacterized protein n=1 Tax=Aldrovandia affinis TaxID=143900 RepID=A0AAD7RYA6_9TELE|nr:hypothetical protein AAFF_G00074170 [Aldrovandia affinis]